MEIRNRSRLEAEFGKNFKKLTKKQKRELLRLMGNPPSLDNVPPSFWRKVRRELEDRTTAILVAIFFAAAAQAIGDAGDLVEGDRDAHLRELEIRSALYGARRAIELAQMQIRKAQERIQKAIDRINQMEREASDRVPEDIMEREFKGAFSADEAAIVVVTETTQARAMGGEAAADVGRYRSPDDRWINRPDLSRTGPCPICLPLHKATRVVWSREFPNGPPAHGHCVCEIEYANER